MNNTNTANHRSPSNNGVRHPSCHVPGEEVVNRWHEWKQTGMGPWSEEHTVTKSGEHTARVCSVVWCSVQDDWGNSRMCPPNWWERLVEKQ